MGLTTLCYLEKDDRYLMLHRIKKEVDVNKDKWIGVGGHFEKDETPEECLLREVKEETGLTLTSWRFRGLVTFLSDAWETEYMCLYTADGFEGDMITCDEGTLEWVKKSELERLNLWEGDKIWLLSIYNIQPHRLVFGILQDLREPYVRKEWMLEKTQEVVRKYMATVQEVACLLGENAAFTDATLRSIMEAPQY